VEDPDEHEMHVEYYEVPPSTAQAINDAGARGNSVWAVGTTSVRSIESAADVEGRVAPGTGKTDLFIRPPYDFKVVQGLITNFHLPKSTLLMLVAAFAGQQRTVRAYQEAIAHGYRFYSYGDAMAVLPRV
jgi:S-adenosylmethionine:tRNA ribosyltransferase-isomerase